MFRKRYRRAQVFRRVSAMLPGNADAGAADTNLMLTEALAALTPRQRAALVLTEMLGYSGMEAAQLLGISSGHRCGAEVDGRLYVVGVGVGAPSPATSAGSNAPAIGAYAGLALIGGVALVLRRRRRLLVRPAD